MFNTIVSKTKAKCERQYVLKLKRCSWVEIELGIKSRKQRPNTDF